MGPLLDTSVCVYSTEAPKRIDLPNTMGRHTTASVSGASSATHEGLSTEIMGPEVPALG